MNISGSPDISILLMQVIFDLSGPLPVVTINNQSQGPNLGNITWWFTLTSPNGTIIHQGSFAAPDAQGDFSTIVLTDSWPMPFKQIEWSGAPYNLTVSIQDSASNQYSDPSYNAFICRPSGCTSSSKNYFGQSFTNVQVMCNLGSVFFQDNTNPSYQGLFGTRLSASLKMAYPIDNTGNFPSAFSITNFTAAGVPITYSSDNYQFQTQIVYQYALSTQVFVNIRYQTLSPKNQLAYQRFSVWCNIDLMPLICEYQKLIESIEHGTCVDADEAIRKLNLINPKWAMVGIGMMQPLTGVDVPALIREIQNIGGFECDCFNAPTGIIPNTSGVAGGLTFSVVPQGGDISGSFEVVGSNVQLLLSDRSYIFQLASNIPTTAFTISPSVSGSVKTYTMNVNMVQLAEDILNTIADSVDLVNLFNTIVAGNNANLQLTVNGKCIFQSSSTFNYSFTLLNIPASGTNALLDSITNGGTAQALNFSFNQTNLPQLQTYLNGLGLGVFAVTNSGGGTVVITSNGNANKLSEMQYSISNTDFVANFSSNSAGYVPISANQVVQNIINYVCGLNDSGVVTSAPYTITYVDSTGSQQTVIIPAGTSLSSFFTALTNLIDQTVENIGGSVTISCAAIKNAFPQSENPIASTDYVLMTKGGVCAQGALLDVFVFMLTTGMNNASVQQAFCAFVESCGAGMACDPYDFFEVQVSQFNPACSPIVGIVYTLG